MSVSDEDFVRWMDGEADEGLNARITAMDDTERERRVSALRLDQTALKSAFDAVSDAAPAMPDGLGVDQNRHGWGRAAMVAAACVVFFVVGLGARSMTEAPALASWQEYAAAYHALYVPETLASIDRADTAKADELTRTTARLGKPYELSQLTAAGLDYRRAQVLGFEQKPLIQLSFVAANGNPIALCIIKTDGNNDAGIVVGEIVGMPSATWAQDGREFLLVGRIDDRELNRLAATFRERL